MKWIREPVEFIIDKQEFEATMLRYEVMVNEFNQAADKCLEAAAKAKEATRELNKALDKVSVERRRKPVIRNS